MGFRPVQASFPAVSEIARNAQFLRHSTCQLIDMPHLLSSILIRLAIVATVFTWISPIAHCQSPATISQPRPNVIIIYGDDQGTIDLGCFGASDLQTPHLDGLAAQGLRLTQMYSAAPVCSASRVGLLTGRYPARAGQPSNGPLASSEITIAELFQQSGYATGLVGKWHLGEQPAQLPSAQGFSTWFGHLQGCIDNYSHFFFWNGPNRHDLWENGEEIYRPGQYFPDLMVDRCKQFISTHRQQPFLLYWAFNAPHYPYQGTPKWLEHYKDLPTPRREYCAFVSSLDESIGAVLNHLEELGLAENTIVVYQPDHGHSTEVRAFGGGGNSGIYRGAKFSLFEGGIRVPCVVRFPSRWPAGEVRDQFTTACDWLPTLAELCQVPLPDTHLDGVSLREVLAENKPLERGPFYWQLGSGPQPQWAVRQDHWKLIGNPVDTTKPESERINGGRLETPLYLIDLEKDPSEKQNVADQHPEIVKRLLSIRNEITASF